MDQALRNGLWNLLTEHYFVEPRPRYGDSSALRSLYADLWTYFFKKPVDTIPKRASDRRQLVRRWFFNAAWYEAYDLCEFVATHYEYENKNRKFRSACNDLFSRELAGYRFVDKELVPITSEQEIAEIEEALTSTSSLTGVQEHLQEALKLLGDKSDPNYRNVVKESISAVESLCMAITGDDNATLGQALGLVEDDVELHGALKSAFSSLYGYTSDADGIRHALLDKSNLSQEDAKFMLVACTSFINYLTVKASKAGIELS